MREEAEMAEGAAGDLGEILARVDERFDRSEEKSAERFDRVDERFDRADERLARSEEKTDEQFGRIDERFDQWLERIDERLVRIEERGTERFTEAARRLDYVDSQLERTNDRLDSMVRVMIAGNVSLTVGILAGFVSIVALILTQL